MSTSESTYNDNLRRHSKTLVTQDGRIIVDLMLNVHDRAISLSLLPFCALYCRSAKEFLSVVDTGNEVEKEVKDIRDGLKVFTGRHSKGVKMVSDWDTRENELYRGMLKFAFTKTLNIHLNLGVYFNEHGRIVFNTQLANFYLNIPTKRENKSANEHASDVGAKLGYEIAEILIKYCGILNLKNQETFFNSVPQYGYIDYNTNRKNVFFSKEFDKEANLIILHMLSTIGFVNNLLVPVFQNKNAWLMRILYVTAHNTCLGIEKTMRHLEQSQQNKAKSPGFVRHFEGEMKLFSSPFRNCMMHYDLVDKNDVPAILPEWYDPDKPLYGLVESCYGGMHFDQYYDKLYMLSKELEKYLLSYFSINKENIRWDWG